MLVKEGLTIYACVIGFYVHLFHLAVLDGERVSFTPITTEDSGSVECESKCLGESGGWVCKKANLLIALVDE